MCLTWCDVVTDQPTMLIEAMDYISFRWYPKDMVYEECRDFNQQQYRAVVYTYPNNIRECRPLHDAYGFGVMIDMAIQEAAYICLALLCLECHILERSTFR